MNLVDGLLAPAATPKAEVERLNAALQKVLADPAVQQRFANLGAPTPSSRRRARKSNSACR